MKNRILSFAIILVMCYTFVPLRALAAYENEPNNDYKTATTIALNETIYANFNWEPWVYMSSIGSDTDWYKVSLPQAGRIKMSFKKPSEFFVNVRVLSVDNAGVLTESYYLSLYGLTNSVLEYSTHNSDNIYLPAGDYYIQVYAREDMGKKITDYTMTVSYTEILDGAMELEPNNDFKIATYVPINAPIRASFPNTYNTGGLQSQKINDTDWFRFTLTQPGNVQILFNRPAKRTFNMRIHGVEVSGELRQISAFDFFAIPNSVNDYIAETGANIGLSAGDYYVQIWGSESSDGPTDYTISFVSFLDFPSSWALERIIEAIHAELVPRPLQSQFTQATTRAEFCTLAVTLYENMTGKAITDRTSFDDTTDENVEKAAAIGIVSGVGNNKFDPNAQLTREQAATMLSRLADAIGKPLSKQAATFADNDSISSWANESVGQVQAIGIMGGIGNNTFAPQAPYTREQSIITIMRLYDVVK